MQKLQYAGNTHLAIYLSLADNRHVQILSKYRQMRFKDLFVDAFPC